MTTINKCNDRCGKNWFYFCKETECFYFNAMLREAETLPMAAFVAVGEKTIGAKYDDKR